MCRISNEKGIFTFFVIIYYKFSPPTGGFFLAPAEGCSLWLHQKGPSGPKVILPDERTDNGFEGQLDNSLFLEIVNFQSMKGKKFWIYPFNTFVLLV